MCTKFIGYGTRCKRGVLNMKVSLNSMKWALGLSAILGSVAPICFAAGNEGSGGGAQIESAFRIRAYELISRIAATPAADALCPASTMQDALEGTKIRVVDQLVDPQTHQPITNQKLDAWTTSGEMQLKQASWARFLNFPILVSGKSVDVLILHEVYRATAGKCDDNNFKISDKIFRS